MKKRIVTFFFIINTFTSIECTQMLMAPSTSRSVNSLSERVAESVIEASGGVQRSVLRRSIGFVGGCLSTAVKRTIKNWRECPLWVKGMTAIGIACFSLVGATAFGVVILSSSLVFGLCDLYNWFTQNVSATFSSIVDTVVDLTQIPTKLISNAFEALGIPKSYSKPLSLAVLFVMALVVALSAFSWFKAKRQEGRESKSAIEKFKGLFLENSGKRKPLNKQKKTSKNAFFGVFAFFGVLCLIGFLFGTNEPTPSINEKVELQIEPTQRFSLIDTDNDDLMSLDQIVNESIQSNEKQRGDEELNIDEVVNKLHSLRVEDNPLLVSSVNTIKDVISGSNCNSMHATIPTNIVSTANSNQRTISGSVSTVNSKKRTISSRMNGRVSSFISTINSNRRTISSNMNTNVSNNRANSLSLKSKKKK